VTQSAFTPNALISAILRAPVALFWNGGIGTYVRASSETNAAVGDRSNDAVRIEASELRARVVVEGGNLGLTQAARIEYALAGGKINTDFIDNSGGVNCSDREVNLKILLGNAEKRGELERADRDKLVADAADQVVTRILYDSFQQAQMLSQEERASLRRVGAYEQLMTNLEAEGILDRKLEGLPSTEALAERARNGRGLTRPELAVLLVDAKRSIYEALVPSTIPDDPYLVADLRKYFPEAVIDRYANRLDEHPLRREIVANILANDVVNSMGSTFVSRLCQRSGSTVAEVIGAYRVARDVSGAVARWETLEGLVHTLDHDLWTELMTGADRAVAGLTRRYQSRGPETSLEDTIAADSAGFAEFEAALPTAGPKAWRATLAIDEAALVEQGVPIDLARRHIHRRRLVHGPDAIELARRHNRKVAEVAEVMFRAGEEVGVGHLEKLAAGFFFTDTWQRWALEALEDDLVELRRRLTGRILMEAADLSPQEAVERYMAANASALDRLRSFLSGLGTDQPDNLALLMIGVRQLRALLA
jgi:glutamate dehydrogenase